MEHLYYEELLILKLSDELNSEQFTEIENHILNCSICQNEQIALGKLFKDVKNSEKEVPMDLLYSVRRDLRKNLELENSKSNIFENIFGFAKNIFTENLKFVSASFAIFIVGIFIGYKFLNVSSQSENSINILSSADAVKLEQGKQFISGFKYITTESNSSNLELFFESVTPMRYASDLSDKTMQKLVEHAILRDDNPGIRLQLLNTVAIYIAEKKEISNSLSRSIAKVAMFDENPGVRRIALENLLHLPFDNEVRSAVVHILGNDENVGLRTSAINF